MGGKEQNARSTHTCSLSVLCKQPRKEAGVIKQNMLVAVEDIKLNSTVFHWPEHIQTVFELSNSRIISKRESLEEDLRKRVSAFEDKLHEYMKEVESFRKKEVSGCIVCMELWFLVKLTIIVQKRSRVPHKLEDFTIR